MSSDFAAACRQTARGLRRAGPELRRALADRVTPEIAAPLAGDVAGAFTGPWGGALAAGTRARKLADPTIVIGGSRPVVSGGASVRQLVYGNEFGGGRRVAKVSRRTRHGQTTYRARTTRQFRAARPAIFPTIRRAGGWVLDAFAGIALDTLERVTDG